MNVVFEVIIIFVGNVISNRYGMFVLGNNSIIFLYGECYMKRVFIFKLRLCLFCKICVIFFFSILGFWLEKRVGGFVFVVWFFDCFLVLF